MKFAYLLIPALLCAPFYTNSMEMERIEKGGEKNNNLHTKPLEIEQQEPSITKNSLIAELNSIDKDSKSYITALMSSEAAPITLLGSSLLLLNIGLINNFTPLIITGEVCVAVGVLGASIARCGMGWCMRNAIDTKVNDIQDMVRKLKVREEKTKEKQDDTFVSVPIDN